MAGEPIRVEGLRDLNRALREIDVELPKEVRQINRDAAAPVAAAARGLVPRRTGKLLGTIRVGGTQRSGVVSAGTRRVPYAGPIHWGWPRRGIRADTFLVDALDRHRDDIVRDYETNLQTLMDRVFSQVDGRD